MVAIGAGSNTYVDALVVSEVVGLKNDVIVGDARPLAIFGDERRVSMADVPTLSELPGG